MLKIAVVTAHFPARRNPRTAGQHIRLCVSFPEAPMCEFFILTLYIHPYSSHEPHL